MTRRVKKRLVLGVLIVVALGGTWLAFRASRSDRDRLQGEWKLKSAIFSGDEVDPDKVKAMSLTVDGDVWTQKVRGSPSSRYRVTLDPKKSPKEFDETQLGPDGEPVTILVAKGRREPIARRGLYEQNGSMLRIALAQEGDQRPTSLEPGDGKLVYSYEWTWW